MTMKKILITLSISIIYFTSFGQLNIGGKPYSLVKEIKAIKTEKKISRIEMPPLDFEKLKYEDNINDSKDKPYRFGKAIDVNYDLKNSGEWIYLLNGDRIWKLAIYCPSAKSISLTYDKFWIPEGGSLFIYDKNKNSIIGGFNSNNNKGTKLNPLKFATGLIESDEVVLEYYEPKEFLNENSISISKIIYGYRNVQEISTNNFGSATCSVNVNCSPEGDNWQDEKKSVALIIMNGAACTGSLLNNTLENGAPYLLTADHCIDAFNLDAISDPDASFFLYYWNYESSGCSNGIDFTPLSTAGATVIANDVSSDFALLELLESPLDLTPQIQVYFNGWDRQTPSGSTVGIHHPLKDLKKISTDFDSPTSWGSGYWKVHWDSTANGNSIIYPGSSGSPLYNNQSRVIGQAHSIWEINCSNQSTTYGRLSYSWDNGSVLSRRLKEWLDPNSSGVNYLNGTYCTGTEYISNINYDSSAIIYGCSINMQNVKVRNGAKIIFNAANNTTINSDFEVELGSETEIK